MTAPLTTTSTVVADLAGLRGSHLGESRSIRVDQERIDRFGAVTEDLQWIHVDPDRAAAGPFGTTIAHGFLLVSLIAPLLGEVLTVTDADSIVNIGLDDTRFLRPVPSGSDVRLTCELADVRAVRGGVEARIAVTLLIDDGPPAVRATSIIRFLSAS